MPAINENLKQLRLANGMTQADVAEAISVTRQTVSSYESGRTQPDIETLKRLAEVFQADMHDVLYGGNRQQRKLRRIKLAACILAAVMLLGILANSAIQLINHTFFPLQDGVVISDSNRPLLEMHMTLSRTAEQAIGISAGIYWIGSLVMLQPVISVINAVKFRRLLLFFGAVFAAMFALSVPFAIHDDTVFFANYLYSLLGGITAVLLNVIVLSAAKLIKRRRIG